MFLGDEIKGRRVFTSRFHFEGSGRVLGCLSRGRVCGLDACKTCTGAMRTVMLQRLSDSISTENGETDEYERTIV